jgi:hypothetical protein
MRYGIAIAISIILILSMFGYVKFFDMKQQKWKDVDVALPATTLVAMSIARLIHNYWHIFSFLFVVIPLAVAALVH